MDPNGKVALVTGGARRVGRALSLALARAGADLVVHFNSSAADANAVVGEIEALGRRALAVSADLGRTDQPQILVDAARNHFGRLDILVNSAASFESKKFHDITAEEWDEVMALNLKAPFLLMQAAAPLLAKHEDGVIINIADLSAFQAWPSYAHHAVSKAGLVHLTRVAARALAPEIRVNAIAPGTVLPPEGYTNTGSDGTSDRRLVRQAGSPDDVARTLLYLVECNFITGQTIVLDGGRILL